MRVSLDTQVIIWVSIILILSLQICIGMKVLAWFIDPDGIKEHIV